MFTGARLRITLLYLALMGVTLVVVAGGLLLVGSRQARRSDDLSLRLRAEGVATAILRPPPPRLGAPGDQGVAPPRVRFLPPFLNDRDRQEFEQQLRLERQGIVTNVLLVEDGRIVDPDMGTGLPSLSAAGAALAGGAPRYDNVSVDDGDVRVYSLPVTRDGQTVAVVQVARSSYFVNTTLTRLLLAVLGLGAAGLSFSALAGFWLAGRTLRPIAVALQRQRDFTADASHEIRTPLALVRGNAELLMRHPDRTVGEYLDVVQDILDESDRLTRLVTNLLTLARADDGRLQLALSRVDLSALADTLLREFEPVATAKGLALRTVVQPGVAVWADADRLHELGVILLDNALRYTDAGEVTLTVRSEAHGAVLAVRDTGSGIAAEHLPSIFDRFYRVDAARSPERGGTGLGLAIARWIAEAHDGRIEVSSRAGQGTTFTVHLPRPAPALPATERRPSEADVTTGVPAVAQPNEVAIQPSAVHGRPPDRGD